METPKPETVTRDLDRHNSWVFAISHLLIYFASPVVYVGIVQAALCDKLGAGATVANLPNSAYFLGFFFPVILSWTLAYRFEQKVVVAANLVTSSSLVLVALSLFLPVGGFDPPGSRHRSGARPGAGGLASIVYMYQCLKRGHEPEGPGPLPEMDLRLHSHPGGGGEPAGPVHSGRGNSLPLPSPRLRASLPHGRGLHGRGRLSRHALPPGGDRREEAALRRDHEDHVPVLSPGPDPLPDLDRVPVPVPGLEFHHQPLPLQPGGPGGRPQGLRRLHERPPLRIQGRHRFRSGGDHDPLGDPGTPGDDGAADGRQGSSGPGWSRDTPS